MSSNLKVNELFSGIGAQAKSLERLGIEHEIVCTSDIDKDAILSYAAVHCELTLEMVNNYSSYPSKNEMAQYLTGLNIGYDFKLNKPYDWFKLARRKNKALEKYWLATILSKQVGDISNAAKLPHADLWTYSFPCTDISVAGNQKGLAKGGNTRSGLLWEIERLLNISQSHDELPTYLLMENVANLVGKEFSKDFYKWLNFLESLGYENHWSILNAKDYGIPQNRERVFAISILKSKEQEYEFPLPFKLELRLKDLLEADVDERFYLSDTAITELLRANEALHKPTWLNEGGIAPTIDTKAGNLGHWSPYIVTEETAKCIEVCNLYESGVNGYNRMNGSVLDISGTCGTIRANSGGHNEVKIAEPLIAASRGRNPDNSSDRTIGSPTEQRLEINEQGISNTLTSVRKDNHVIEPCAMRYERNEHGKQIRKDYESGKATEKMGNMRDLAPRTDGLLNTLTTVEKDNYILEPSGIYTGVSAEFQRGPLQGLSRCLKANNNDAGAIYPTYRIRKLTPLECWRLMDFDNEDVFKAKAVGMSDSQLYKQAGNSIVVACLYHQLRKLFVDIEITQPKQLSLF